MTCHKFSKEFISRFVDNDLDADQHQAFIHHKTQCSDCRAVEAQFRQAGTIFERQAQAMAGQLLQSMPEIRVSTNHTNHESGRNKIFRHNPRRLQALLGMLSIAVVAVIMYFASPHQGQIPAVGPSAVVNSVDSYGASVMILETAETRHTIIWFSET